jgi:hypothetical protein
MEIYFEFFCKRYLRLRSIDFMPCLTNKPVLIFTSLSDPSKYLGRELQIIYILTKHRLLAETNPHLDYHIPFICSISLHVTAIIFIRR